MDDRRRHPRRQSLISAHVRYGTRIYEGTIVDISKDGCFVATPAPVERENAIQLRFKHPQTKEMVKIRAVVARRVRPGSGRLGLGLKLIDTQGRLEHANRNLQASTSSTRSRPGFVSRAGTPGAYGGSHPRRPTGEVEPVHSEVGDRRDAATDRVDAGRRRIRIQQAGGVATMGFLLNMSERGFSAASERAPPVGKLFRLELDHEDNRNTTMAAKCTWRAEAPGGLRSFGGTLLQFSSHEAAEAWADLLASLRG